VGSGAPRRDDDRTDDRLPAGGCEFKWSDVSGYPQYPKAVRNFYDFFGFLNRNRVVSTENGHCWDVSQMTMTRPEI
jgi:hypothetical protein